MIQSTKKKALIVTTVSGFVPQFEMKNVQILQSMGYEVHYATNYHIPVYTDNNDRLIGTNIVQHQIDFVRSPFQILRNHRAYNQLCKLMNLVRFDLVHCHTPMGSVIARLAAIHANKMPIIYTAHGFHFFKGAPILNWFLFYPVERALTRHTDCLITMNQEDYVRAKGFSMCNHKEVYKINGIGIPVKEYLSNDNKVELKADDHPFTLVTVGELTKRKNQVVLLEAVAQLKEPLVKVIICGTGTKLNELKNRARELGIQSQVEFRGYCIDIMRHLREADCFVFPSLQEGLPVALMEAMAAGLPIICSNIRGNKDLVQDGVGGYLVGPRDVQAYVEAIMKLKKSKELRINMGKINQINVEQYDDGVVEEQMKKIYEKTLKP
jgi:glycosyltransferase involved in cell wall biosynthesis